MDADDVVEENEMVTYQVLPNVLLPFCSARRKNCAALNCEALAPCCQPQGSGMLPNF